MIVLFCEVDFWDYWEIKDRLFVYHNTKAKYIGEMESSATDEIRAPMPPPLPSPATVSYQWRRSRRYSCCCAASMCSNPFGDRLFDEGYRADVLIHTSDNGIIYAHANVLGVASPVLKGMLKQTRKKGRCRYRSISILGVPPEAVNVFVRFLYSSCYEDDKMEEHALHLLLLSHAYVVPPLKRLCQWWIQHRLLNTATAVDIFQLAMLCDAPRLSLFCHRFILKNMKAVSATEGWKVMKESHPILEQEILASVVDEDARKKDSMRKSDERKIYQQLYEAMEAVVHIFTDGCRTIGPHDKVLKEDQSACSYEACKGLELLVRHFAMCKRRIPGGCIHCKRMWQVLELHSRLCNSSENCRVPLCSKFKQRTKRQSKEDVKWRILVRKIVRSKSITGAPFFCLESS